jgi:hypothetical protein
MLKTLDVAIGFAFVMLAASSAVTVLTQTVVNALQLRGWTLRDGLARLFRQADGALATEGARALAEAVLRHPLLSGVNGRRAAVVSREELVPILLHLARPSTAGEPADPGRLAARDLVARMHVGDPIEALRDIRHLELRIEAADPGTARHVRAAQAVITAAASDLTAVLFSWFDQTMDRVRDRFVSHTRWITVGGALLVTLALPLDAIRLVNRLSADRALRDALVAQGGRAPTAGDTLPAFTTEERGAVLGTLGLRPFSPEWRANWDAATASGLLLSWVFLSLGAPFWFEMLKNLTRLRPLLAKRDEDERQERSSGEPAPVRTLVVTGESGDLVATARG